MAANRTHAHLEQKVEQSVVSSSISGEPTSQELRVPIWPPERIALCIFLLVRAVLSAGYQALVHVARGQYGRKGPSVYLTGITLKVPFIRYNLLRNQQLLVEGIV